VFSYGIFKYEADLSGHRIVYFAMQERLSNSTDNCCQFAMYQKFSNQSYIMLIMNGLLLNVILILLMILQECY